MSEQSSTSGSRFFLIAALTVMVLGLSWSGWQWQQAKRQAAPPASTAPASTPSESEAPTEEPAARPVEAPRGGGEILSG